MDAALLAGTTMIGADDDLWHLGDFACSETAADRAQASAMFGVLPGRKHLVRGNHDDDWVARALPWVSVHDLVEVEAGGCRFVLCHYPLLTWNGAHEGAVHLFGHVHTDWRGAAGQVNVGVDQWSFKAVTAAEAELEALMLPMLSLPWRR
ncbi:metallophosphoesterase [Paracoccus sp. S-4012]|nr:metallophosphoesterase [Paracoccus sp. S-4012]